MLSAIVGKNNAPSMNKGVCVSMRMANIYP